MTVVRSGSNKRCFPRYVYRGTAKLTSASKSWSVHLMDISLNGVLVALLYRHNLEAGDPIVLKINVPGEQSIRMQGKVAHICGHFIGCECFPSNLDHQNRLKDLLQNQQTHIRDVAQPTDAFSSEGTDKAS